MSAIVQTLNTAGQAFLGLAVPLLIQSSLLILILLAVDAVLRKRVRAVFRYWIWMLVLVKLVLPPSLWSPVSVGTWFGGALEVPAAGLLEPPQLPSPEEKGQEALAMRPSPAVANFLSPPQPTPVAPPLPEPGGPAAPGWGPITPEGGGATPLATHPPAVSLNWQGFALLVWAAIVAVLLLLLAQRTFFVRGLVAQADEASRALLHELDRCRQHLGLRQRISARLSPNTASPAVCGLWRPVILIPQNLASRLHGAELQAVLFHELAHVKRGDLWVNLIQTLLQIVYFYNPLLWLANAIIRRIREKAVDEMVFVAMGEAAPQYPDTLINVAKLALARRPTLSLRLIGVVESKSALTSRIKHILNRPLPKTAKLGLLGLSVVLVIAAVLLPMARAAEESAGVDNRGPLDIQLVGVCPDGGDELYDANGKKLDMVLGPLGGGEGPWKAEEFRRDFILQVPRFEGQLLFVPFASLRPAGMGTDLGKGLILFDAPEGPATAVVQGWFRRTYRQRWAGLFAREVPVRKVDLTLRYFHGSQRNESLCSFTGPFTEGTMRRADEGRPYQLTPRGPQEPWRVSHLSFDFTTSQPFDIGVPLLIYDRQGRRYLAGNPSGHSGTDGTQVTYDMEAVPWDQIAAVRVGEKPQEMTFRNVVVAYPQRPRRTYPEHWDRMMERLGLTGFPPENLARQEIKTARDAMAVLDIIRGCNHIQQAAQAVMLSQNPPGGIITRRSPVGTLALDAPTCDKIGQAARRWLGSPSVQLRAVAVKLGLTAGLREFLDPAFTLLEYRGSASPREERGIHSDVLLGLWYYRDHLTTTDLERLRQFARRCDEGETWGHLFEYCFRTAHRPEVADVLWELAQEERAWLWWPAIRALRERGDERLKASAALPEVVRLRATLASAWGQPAEEALRPKLRAMLRDLFTVETVRLCPQGSHEMYRALETYLDRQQATAVYVDFLRAASPPQARWRFELDYGGADRLYNVVAVLLRDLNLWYGVNLGHLGTPGPDNVGIVTSHAFDQAVAEALDWYRTSGLQQLSKPIPERRVEPQGNRENQAEVVLPEVDRQHVILDLATGQLVPVPPVGPDPEKIQQALRKLGKGDLLYDCVQGDRALGLLRDATSEQAREPAGEPSIKGHLIGSRLPEVMTIKTAEGGQYRITILAADDKACTLKYFPVSTDKGTGGGALAEPDEISSPLELRIAPTRNDLERAVVDEYRKALAEGRTAPGGRYLWVPVRPDAHPRPDLVGDTYGGQGWLLVHNDDPAIMVPAQGWRIAHVGRDLAVAEGWRTGRHERPRVTVAFDDSGAERMYQLTRAYGDYPLAILVQGQVVATPTIFEGPPFRDLEIVGDFTEQQVQDMIAALSQGLEKQPAPPSPSPAPSAGAGRTPRVRNWQDVGGLIPADANDGRVLAPGVVLEGIGQDVEGKVFVSGIRDVAPTRDRQYRFVLVPKAGPIREPSDYTSVERSGGDRLWEKFAFDPPYDRGQIEGFRWQSRPAAGGPDSGTLSVREQIQAAAAGKPSVSREPAPGRYALAFDGKKDYLFVPNSPSLQTDAPLFIEAWIKPQIEPGDDGRGQGLLAKGCYTQAGKGNIQGIGMRVERRARDPMTLSFDCVAGMDNKTIPMSSANYLNRPNGQWIHIVGGFHLSLLVMGDVFARGQPLVVGRFLTPTVPPFQGQIGEIRLWKENPGPSVSGDEPLTGNEPGLIACWTFEEGSGQIAYDISPNHNHARLGSSLGVDDADPEWIALSDKPEPVKAGDSAAAKSEKKEPSGGPLDLRIAPTAEEVGSELVEKYKQTLTGGGRLPDGDLAWFEVRPGTVLVPGQITCEHNGKTYLLLWNDKSHVMLADGTWGVEEVRATTDNMGVPWIVLTFDAKGVQLLHELGDANLRHSLAVVFEGRVIAIPFISTTLSGTDCPISGRFTAEEIQEMIAVLKTRLPAPRQTQDLLKRRTEEVRPGRVVLMPNGRHTTPVQITEPMVLRGESAEGCIIEVTADQPALLVDTQGKGQVILENLTIRWQLAGNTKMQLPAALLVKGTNAVIRNCRFAPLGDFRRSPMAVYIDRPSKSTVDDCRFSGFDYVVCYGPGAEGIVQDCVITDCGHQGVIGYDGSTLTVQRNIITGSKFHAVRCTGGTLHVKDNLLIKNANRGIYLGNKTGQGTIANNLILGNGSGISGFGQANYVIANNVVADNSFSGIDMRDSCRFSIRNNVLVKNQRGLALFKEGTEDFNVVGKNAFWANATDVENLEKPAGSLTADPQFADPNRGDFAVQGAVREQEHGLTNPQILKNLWQRYEQLRTPSAGADQPQS